MNDNSAADASVAGAEAGAFEQLVALYQRVGWDLSSFCYALAEFTQTNSDRFVSPLQVQLI